MKISEEIMKKFNLSYGPDKLYGYENDRVVIFSFNYKHFTESTLENILNYITKKMSEYPLELIYRFDFADDFTYEILYRKIFSAS